MASDRAKLLPQPQPAFHHASAQQRFCESIALAPTSLRLHSRGRAAVGKDAAIATPAATCQFSPVIPTNPQPRFTFVAQY